MEDKFETNSPHATDHEKLTTDHDHAAHLFVFTANKAGMDGINKAGN